MKRRCVYGTIGIALTMLGAAMATGEPAVQDTFEATLVKPLATADVIRVRAKSGGEHEIRLYGVASPLAEQPFAGAAARFLAKLAEEDVMTVEVLAEDGAGIPVCRVRLGDGSSINERLLQEGLAWWDEVNAPQVGEWKKFAAEAIVAGKGLWKEGAPLAPWDYRTSHNLPPVRYRVESKPLAEMEDDLEPLAPETPTIEAKGTAKPGLPAGISVAPEEYLSLAAKHQPQIARDGQGNPLGLTANDISGIPGASQIGFKNGDIVQSVNGIKLTSEAQIFGLVSQLQRAKSLDLVVIRGGKPVTITIPL